MARKIAPDAQEAIATAKFIRMSPTKARQVVDIIRGRHVEDARRVLRFNQRGASSTVGKVLESAIANAEHNRGLPGDELVVARAWVDEGPTLKRFRPRAMGRATRIRKRTCHISIVVGRSEELAEAAIAPAAATTTPRKGRRKTGDEAASETAVTVAQTKKRVKKDSGMETKTPGTSGASQATEASPETTSKTEGEAE